MNLYALILYLYQGITPSQFALQDDGNGPYIVPGSWTFPGAAQPTADSLAAESEQTQALAQTQLTNNNLVATYSSNLNTIAAYNAYCVTDPGTTFLGYLQHLQSIQAAIPS